jgi:hypothetical protein
MHNTVGESIATSHPDSYKRKLRGVRIDADRSGVPKELRHSVSVHPIFAVMGVHVTLPVPAESKLQVCQCAAQET